MAFLRRRTIRALTCSPFFIRRVQDAPNCRKTVRMEAVSHIGLAAISIPVDTAGSDVTARRIIL
jgi:hypothetical protein